VGTLGFSSHQLFIFMSHTHHAVTTALDLHKPCHILHFVSHWLVLDSPINPVNARTV
jgi:hypothetical protein